MPVPEGTAPQARQAIEEPAAVIGRVIGALGTGEDLGMIPEVAIGREGQPVMVQASELLPGVHAISSHVVTHCRHEFPCRAATAKASVGCDSVVRAHFGEASMTKGYWI